MDKSLPRRDRISSRLIVFAHYDRDGIIDPYVSFYVRALRSMADRMIFVSTAKLNENEMRSLGAYVDSIIVKENSGYDFGSWKAGLRSEEDLRKYDEIVICNDSVYGPLWPIGVAFKKMETRDCDFWGITASRQVERHIQSYFVVFRRSTICSEAFARFWNSVEPQPTKEDVIDKYEIGLSHQMVKAGFSYKVLYSNPSLWAAILAIVDYVRPAPHEDRNRVYALAAKTYWYARNLLIFLTRSRGGNPTYVHWRDMIRSHVPFVKVDLLKRKNAAHGGWEDVAGEIRGNSSYDTDLIRTHLARISG